MRPRAFKVVLKSRQIFEISHLGAKMTDIDTCVGISNFFVTISFICLK